MKRAVILDRDGVINDNSEVIHVHEPSEFVLFPQVCEAIALLNHHDYLVMVATNQGGVGLGFLSEQALTDVHQEMIRLLALGNARLDAIAACIHPPKSGCSCRKPKPGLLFQLNELHPFESSRSTMVGDRETDVQAGLAAGMRTVLIGQAPTQADFTADSLYDAVQWILKNDGIC